MSRYRTQITEVINRNSLVSLALSRGYNAFLPVYDGGVDFILYNEQTNDLKKVQLKGRWIIDAKYQGRDIWIAFSDQGHWYLVPHDEMVLHAAGYGFTETKSWAKGAYSVGSLSKRMRQDLEQYRFGSLESVSKDAAAEASLGSEGVPGSDET